MDDSQAYLDATLNLGSLLADEDLVEYLDKSLTQIRESLKQQVQYQTPDLETLIMSSPLYRQMDAATKQRMATRLKELALKQPAPNQLSNVLFAK